MYSRGEGEGNNKRGEQRGTEEGNRGKKRRNAVSEKEIKKKRSRERLQQKESDIETVKQAQEHFVLLHGTNLRTTVLLHTHMRIEYFLELENQNTK